MTYTAEDVRHLPLPDLAMALLRSLGQHANVNSLFRGVEQTAFANEPDLAFLLARLSDAWSWLEAHALLAPDPTQTSTQWQRVSQAGRELAADAAAITKVWADERLAGPLDPLLGSAWSNFALGDYETASFAALKAVEVEVRRVSGLPDDLLGVPLMRRAFGPKGGPLADPDAEGGEQQATADLFAGALGTYKNPASHRTVRFDDPVEAAEVVQLADLLRIVHRAERRLSAGWASGE